MVAQALFKEIPVDGLRGGRALASDDDHLAVGRGHTASRIEPRHTGTTTLIDRDLPLSVQLGPEPPRNDIVMDVASRGEDGIDRDRCVVSEVERQHLAAVMFDLCNWLRVDWNMIFVNPA